MTTRKSQLKVMGFAVLVAIHSVSVAQDANGGSEADDFLQAVMRVRSKSEKTIVKDEMSKRELCRQLAERFQRSSGKRIVVYEGYEQPLVLVQEDTASSPPRRGLDNGSISSFVVVSHSKVVDINGKTDSEVNDVMEKQANVRLIAGAGQKAAHVVEDSLANDEAWPLNSNADLSGVTSGTRRAQFEQLEQLLVNKYGLMPGSFGQMSTKLATTTVSFPDVGEVYVRDVVAALGAAVNEARGSNARFQVLPVVDPTKGGAKLWTIVVF